MFRYIFRAYCNMTFSNNKYFQKERSRTICKHESDKNKKCLPVGNFEILSVAVVVVYSKPKLTKAYVEIWNFYLKISNFILDSPKLAIFLIFDSIFWASRQHWLKKYHKNERNLCLVVQIFTKLSQIVCVIDAHTLVY